MPPTSRLDSPSQPHRQREKAKDLPCLLRPTRYQTRPAETKQSGPDQTDTARIQFGGTSRTNRPRT